MSVNSIQRRSSGREDVYEVVDANLAAGLLVIPSTTATSTGLQGVKVATDSATTVLGATAKATITAANQAAASTPTLDGYPGVDASVPLATTTVFSDGVVPLTYTAVAVAYGVRLCAAASGAVRAWVSGTDHADAIIGWCAQVGGVGSGGGVALVKLTI